MNWKNVILAIIMILLLGVIGTEGYVFFKDRLKLSHNIYESTDKDNSEPSRYETPPSQTNWQYSSQEDKLNNTRNYLGRIMSSDGRLELQISDMDFSGDSHYITVLGIVWHDEAFPSWTGESMIGMKFPGDTSYRKIPVNSKGDNTAAFDMMIPDKYVDLLKRYKQFTILYLNEEFLFHSTSPLKWSH